MGLFPKPREQLERPQAVQRLPALIRETSASLGTRQEGWWVLGWHSALLWSPSHGAGTQTDRHSRNKKKLCKLGMLIR